MPDMWERARVRHESTPVPEELEFAVASALRAGQRRLRGRPGASPERERGAGGLRLLCAAGQRQSGLCPGGVRRAGAGRSGPGGHRHGVPHRRAGAPYRRAPARPGAAGDTDLEQRINLAIQTRIDQVLQEAEDRRGPSATPMWPPAVRRRTSSPS